MLDGMLKPGEKLNSEKGVQYTVREMLGAGGQGEVYRIDSPNGPMALKWYYKQTSTENQKKIIMDLVEDGSPSPKFLWPVDFINSKFVINWICFILFSKIFNIKFYFF